MFPSDTNLEAQFTFETPAQRVPDEASFKILLLGDWSGREGRRENVDRNPIVIDRDNFDEVFKSFGASLDLDGDGRNIVKIDFRELDDFHPDRIFEQVPLFGELHELRGRLLNQSTFESAAEEVRAWFEDEESEVPDSSADGPQFVEIDSGNLLDRIISQNDRQDESPDSGQVSQSKALSGFINKIVKPHIIRTDEDEQARLLGIIDEATSQLMRSILHHPLFQALESAWRGVYLLVRQIDTDVDLKLFLLDISKDELGADLKSVNNLADSLLSQLLITETVETPGGEPFSLVCGNYAFNANVEDIATLIRLAKLSSAARAPFISYLLPDILGITSLAETPNLSEWNVSDDSDARKLWLTLRSLPEAEYLGLVMPRFLVRLPYGESTDPTETFSFDEFAGAPNHENYLWANPSFACALLLAKSYRAHGWELVHGVFQTLNDLPTHIYEEAGESKTKPCAEILMTEDACQRLLDEGIMPLISYRNSDRVELARFQSIASPLKSLGGRWK